MPGKEGSHFRENSLLFSLTPPPPGFSFGNILPRKGPSQGPGQEQSHFHSCCCGTWLSESRVPGPPSPWPVHILPAFGDQLQPCPWQKASGHSDGVSRSSPSHSSWTWEARLVITDPSQAPLSLAWLFNLPGVLTALPGTGLCTPSSHSTLVPLGTEST